MNERGFSGFLFFVGSFILSGGVFWLAYSNAQLRRDLAACRATIQVDTVYAPPPGFIDGFQVEFRWVPKDTTEVER